jgi:uncharacterized LabA/DUF88 family protein
MLEAVAYVDGLNLYHGMEDAELLDYRWLDIEHMCQMLAHDAGSKMGEAIRLVRVTYCTSFVLDSQKRAHQDTWLEAVASHSPNLSMRFGKYDPKTEECPKCGTPVTFHKEKQTDVNLAVEMMRDAAGHPTEEGVALPQIQILVTGDTDLIPTIKAVKEAYGLPVVVAAPPRRGQEVFGNIATKYLRVGKRHLRYSPLPGIVDATVNGFPLTPPGSWKHPDDW